MGRHGQMKRGVDCYRMSILILHISERGNHPLPTILQTEPAFSVFHGHVFANLQRHEFFVKCKSDVHQCLFRFL